MRIPVALLILGLVAALPPRVEGGLTPANILVIYSNDRDLPANIEVERGLLEDRPGREPGALRVFPEYLGAPTFSGEAFEAATADYLAGKYAALEPRVIVAGGVAALSFVLRNRERLFPHTPVVHVAVDRNAIARRQLPEDVVGIPVDYDFTQTIELALRLQPGTRKLVVVTGIGDWGVDQEAQLRSVIGTFAPAVEVEFLRGLTTAAVLERLSSLDEDTVVFSTGYYQDAAGEASTPYSSVKAMAEASRAPVYAPFATQLGTGIVGGRVTSFAEMGRASRDIVDQIVAGVATNDLSIPASLPATARVDERQLRRWHISARRLPAGSVIEYRSPSLWEAHRQQVLWVLAVLLLQALLIAGLLMQRVQWRKATAALGDSERRMRVAAKAARLTPFDLDLSPAAEADFRKWLESVHPADRERAERLFRQAAAAPGTDFEVEFRRQAGGAWHWYAARGHHAVEAPRRLAGISMDISDRKAVELRAEADRSALTRLSRIAVAGQLSAAIAHQMNQPLAAILGNAETARRLLLRGDAGNDVELREILDDIITEDNRAAEIIRGLNALYRRGNDELVALDLNELVRETKLLMHTGLTQRQVQLLMRLEEPLPTVLGSRVQLQQVLMNLILNAADAIAQPGDGVGQVTVRTRYDAGAGEVVTSVEDHGPGIAEANLRHVFEPFWSTKPGGIGVGLAICESIVKSCQGRIWAGNNPDGGAVFFVALPARAR